MQLATRSVTLAATVGASVWLTLSGVALSAVATPSPEAQITVIEASYTPESFYFQVDQTVANCAAGTWLKWDGKSVAADKESNDSNRRMNVRFMAQSVLAAKLAGARVKVFAANASASTNNACLVENIYFL